MLEFRLKKSKYTKHLFFFKKYFLFYYDWNIKQLMSPYSICISEDSYHKVLVFKNNSKAYLDEDFAESNNPLQYITLKYLHW